MRQRFLRWRVRRKCAVFGHAILALRITDDDGTVHDTCVCGVTTTTRP